MKQSNNQRSNNTHGKYNDDNLNGQNLHFPPFPSLLEIISPEISRHHTFDIKEVCTKNPRKLPDSRGFKLTVLDFAC